MNDEIHAQWQIKTHRGTGKLEKMEEKLQKGKKWLQKWKKTNKEQ